MATPTPPNMAESIEHLMDIIKLIGPFVAAIVALIVWSWKKLEKTQDKLEEALTAHLTEDDKVHDQLFTNQRKTGEKLAELIGSHNATHKLSGGITHEVTYKVEPQHTGDYIPFDGDDDSGSTGI